MASYPPGSPEVRAVSPLVPVCNGVYVVNSSLRVVPTMWIHARMTVLVLPGNELLIYSPLPPHLVDQTAIRALGTVRYIIAPNHMHKCFAPAFAALHAGCKLYCSPSLYDTLRPEDATQYGEKLDDGTVPEAVFGGAVTVRVLQHFKPFREVVVLHHPSRTLVIGDLAFNLTSETIMRFISPPFKFLLWLTAGYRPLAWPKTMRLMVKKGDAIHFVTELEDVLNTLDFDRVVPCHGDVVETGGKALLQGGTLADIKAVAYPGPTKPLWRRALFGLFVAGALTFGMLVAKRNDKKH